MTADGPRKIRQKWWRMQLIQIEVAQRLPGVGRFLGALERFLEFLFQQIALVFLGLHRLPEDGLLAAVLVLHGARRRFQVFEGLGNRLGGVRDYSLGVGIDLQDRTAAGTGNFELGRRLSHARILPQVRETNQNRRMPAIPQSIRIWSPEIHLEDATGRATGNLTVVIDR